MCVFVPAINCRSAQLFSSDAAIAQVPCTPSASVNVNLLQLRLTEGGYVKLAVRNVPGNGTLLSVSIRPSAANVTPPHPFTHLSGVLGYG